MTDNKKFAYKAISLTNDIGGDVCRRILDLKIQEALFTSVSAFLNAKRNTLQNFLYGLNGMPKILVQEQYCILFKDGIANTSTESFDITLLIFLLRAFFYSRNKNMKMMWKTRLKDIYAEDTSVLADIVRIKCHRNEIHKMANTRTWFDEAAFYQFWSEFTAVLLRLGPQFGMYNLQDEINKLLNEPFDVEREKALEGLIKDMDKKFIEHFEEIESKKTEMDLLKERSKRELLDVLDDCAFVKTKAFTQIEGFLQNNRIVVITGAQGEGKTTMAKKLVQNPDEFYKINTYSDWKLVSSKTEIGAYILLDDMFGGGILDKAQSRKWRKEIDSIKSAIDNQETKMYIIITSRPYILQEVSFFERLINSQNTFTLSSEDLSQKEMTDILKNHLESVERPYDRSLLPKCIKAAQSSDWFIGFPECARLFSKHDILFEMKGEFFEKPIDHIITCLRQLFEDEQTFLAFFVLWAQINQTLSLRDLELGPEDTAMSILDPIQKLQFSAKYYLRSIRPSLIKHAQKGGFIKFEATNEVIKFSHPVVSDAVGLVICKKNTTAVLAFCSSAFMQTYVCICPTKSPARVSVIPDRYDQLCVRIGQLILPDNTTQLKGRQTKHENTNSVNQTAMETNNEEGTAATGSLKQNVQYLKTALFEHQAFQDSNFCDKFTAPCINTTLNQILSTPVMTLGVALKGLKCLDKAVYKCEIHILAYLLIHKKHLLADKCFKALKELEMQGIIESDLRMSMLMAANKGDSEMIDRLILKGAEIDFNAVCTALERGQREALDNLLGEPKGRQLNNFKKNGLSPLAFFVQKADSKAVEFLLDTGHVDVKSINDESILHKACQLEQTDILNMLLERGANVKVRDTKGYCPIHYAASNGIEHVKTLLKHDKAQATLTLSLSESVDKVSLFHLAAKEQNLDLVNFLAKEDISPNIVDGRGQTPLLFAIRGRKTRILEQLVNISINTKAHLIPDSESNTVLHIIFQQISALESDDTKEIYKNAFIRLCQKGVDMNKENSAKQTVEHIAKTFSLENVLEELKAKL